MPVTTVTNHFTTSQVPQNFDVVVVPKGSNWKDAFLVNEFADRIEWNYSIEQAPVILNIELHDSEGINNKFVMDVGDHLLLFGYTLQGNAFVHREMYRTTIVERTTTTATAKSMEIIGYDPLFYAQRNDVSEVLPSETMYNRYARMCLKYGIPFDSENSERPAKMLARKIVRRNPLWEILQEAYVETNQFAMPDEKYMPRFREGKLRIIKRKIPDSIWVLEEGNNIISVKNKRTIMDMKNDVIIRGSGGVISSLGAVPGNSDTELGEVLAHLKNQPSIDKYGLMSEVIYDSNVATKADATVRAYLRLRSKSNVQETVTVTAENINDMFWGDPVFIYEPLSKSVAVYWVFSGTHVIDENGAIMNLVLTLEDRFDLLELAGENKSASSQSIINKILANAGISGALNRPPSVIGPVSPPGGGVTQQPSDSGNTVPPPIVPISPPPEENNTPVPPPAGGNNQTNRFLNYPNFQYKDVITQTFGKHPEVPDDEIASDAYYLRQGYVNGHPGIDYGTSIGTPLYASAPGKIITKMFASNPASGGRGNHIIISHENGYITIYQHMDSFSEKIIEGSRVNYGTFIGYTGNTGLSSGPHLHFGLQKVSKATSKEDNFGWIDPTPYFSPTWRLS